MPFVQSVPPIFTVYAPASVACQAMTGLVDAFTMVLTGVTVLTLTVATLVSTVYVELLTVDTLPALSLARYL